MNLRRSTRYLICQPIKEWFLPLPTKLRAGLFVTSPPQALHHEHTLSPWIFSGSEIKSMKSYPAWLCCEFLDESSTLTERQKRAIDIVKNTALGIQILSPIGSPDTVVFLLRRSDFDNDWNLLHIEHSVPWDSSMWARMAGSVAPSLNDLRLVIHGVHAAFRSHHSRLTNPLYLFEHGLEGRNLHLCVFLWVTALDSILMAGNSANFEERLSNMLGANSFVFPSVEGFGQPKYQVRDVAKDLYDLRSVIAHGSAIPIRLRQPDGFRDTNDEHIEGCEAGYQYRQVLYDCALFLLAAALKTIFLAGLTPTVRDTPVWREKLKHPF